MAKPTDSTDDAYEAILHVDPFQMINDCGLDNEMLLGLLDVGESLARDLADGEVGTNYMEDQGQKIAAVFRAANICHELNGERLMAAEQMLISAGFREQIITRKRPVGNVSPIEDIAEFHSRRRRPDKRPDKD